MADKGKGQFVAGSCLECFANVMRAQSHREVSHSVVKVIRALFAL